MPPLGLLRLVPVWVYPTLALVIWGGLGQWKATRAQEKLIVVKAEVAQKTAVAEIKARATEQALTESQTKVSDVLSKAKTDSARTSRAADERLRNLAAAWSASAASANPGTSCRDDGAPIVAIIRDEDRRDFVALSEESDNNADRLRACQSWVRGLKDAFR